MAVSIGDRLARQAATELVGRATAVAILAQLLEPDGPLVYHLHGIGGIGKTSLLSLFTTQARTQGSRVICLDCRSIEPTEAGFLHDVAAAAGASAPTLSAIVEQLGAATSLTVLALDSYESFRLLDAWLRQVFIPALPDNVRLLLVGREAPLMVWLTTPGWHGLFRTLTLGPLDEDDACALLEQASVPPLQAAQINRFARGYPLALRLALAAGTRSHDAQLDAATRQRVVEQLSRRYLAEVHDPLTRRALQAATVMRRVNRGLLQAVLPNLDADETYERLRALPFVEAGRDGLVIHDVVRQALAADLLAACIAAGAGPVIAAQAVGEALGGPVGEALARGAAEVRLGGEPCEAWRRLGGLPGAAPLARLLERAGVSGLPAAGPVTRLAADARADWGRAATARARRAAVLVTAPVGLCFLPAFIAVGVLPIVIGLAGGVLGGGGR